MNTKLTRATCFAALCGAVIPVFGCAQAVDHSIADSIKAKLQEAIGPAASYDVMVNADPFQIAQGRLKEVDITGQDVNLSPKLLVDRLSVQAHDIVVDTATQKLRSVGQVDFEAQVNQDSIDHYLVAAAEDDESVRDQNLSVTLNDSTVTASLDVRSFGVKVPVSVTGTFQVDPKDDKHILFEPSEGSLSIVPLPRFVLNLAMRRMNPVIDLSTSTVPVDLTSVEISSNTLNFVGAADLDRTLAQGN